MAYSQLSVTTSAGTTTAMLGNQNSITIDSPSGPSGLAAAIRVPHVFAGFAENGVAPGGFGASDPTNRTSTRVKALSYAAGVITVTLGPAKVFYAGGGWIDDGPTQTTTVTVDDASGLAIDGFGIAARQTIPLSGLSAISLTEATA